MKVYDAANIRVLSLLVGHGGDGKTTLVESFFVRFRRNWARGAELRMAIRRPILIPEEIKRGFSLTAGLAPVEWKNEKFNFIDTPGYFDFVGEATQAYALADKLADRIQRSCPVWKLAQKKHLLQPENGIKPVFRSQPNG